MKEKNIGDKNLKLRQERSATAISVGYWYSRMYHRPMNWNISFKKCK